MNVPVSAPSITSLEEAYAADAVASSRISGSGPYVERFEQAWAERCGVAHAVAVSSGTAALHVLLLAHDVGRGDEVIVPALTYAAVANAVVHTGAVPVVGDVEWETWCLAPASVEALITQRTVGIIAVHAYGHPADMAAILAVAKRHGLWVIEDGSQAHLAQWSGQVVGGLADGGAFSFFGNKILTAGEGGAVTVQSDVIADRVRALRNQGVRTGVDDRYAPSLIGHNFRMSNVAAAIAFAQVGRADELVSRRRQLLSRYVAALSGAPGLTLQPEAVWASPSPWLFSILLDADAAPLGPIAITDRLARNGIETRPMFPPLNALPTAPKARRLSPVARAISETGLSLPLFADMKPDDVDRIADIVVAAPRAPRRPAMSNT
jgi:perosamine synthetase